MPNVAASPRTEAPEFPGCKPVHLPRAEIERFEGRLEYRDSATETAGICTPTTSCHEHPARLLTRLAERIAAVRGSHIGCYGSIDLFADAALAATPEHVLVAAALACEDEATFRAAISRSDR